MCAMARTSRLEWKRVPKVCIQTKRLTMQCSPPRTHSYDLVSSKAAGGFELHDRCSTPQFGRLGLRRRVQQWAVNGMDSDLLSNRPAAAVFDHAAPVSVLGLRMSLLYDAL